MACGCSGRLVSPQNNMRVSAENKPKASGAATTVAGAKLGGAAAKPGLRPRRALGDIGNRVCEEPQPKAALKKVILEGGMLDLVHPWPSQPCGGGLLCRWGWGARFASGCVGGSSANYFPLLLGRKLSPRLRTSLLPGNLQKLWRALLSL